ncbi:ATP-binding protein [Actinophytocola gossypii]|uniref:ATP-binding protein n=1 Tax=Actinophytocola gossypii TaxID=2812003 RepID=UPI0021A5FE8E|nr:ATP-binding protein [Actinophytocola gossypii]
MLVVPAVVALVLGGVRVRGQLDDANRLSTVRDQLAVLTEAVTLSDLVADELVSAVTATDGRGRAAVDRQVNAVRDAADFAGLPASVDRDLGDALGRLDALREQTGDPVALASGYRAVLASLAELVPGVVSLARDEDLDDRAVSVRSLLLLRAALAAGTALVGSGVDGPGRAEVVAAAQDAAAEEAVLSRQLAVDLPTEDAAAVENATRGAADRRATLRSAGGRGAALAGLVPGLDTASAAVHGLLLEVFGDLSDTVSTRTNEARSDALRDAAVVLGALLAALAVALTVARSLLAPLHRLRTAALTAAHEQLPATVERVRAGERVDYRSVAPVPVHTREEIGQLARAFDDMHRQAVRLAGEQAELRLQVSEMFMTLSRRSQSLVELQLGVIEELEADEQDPRRLAGLFRLDHLATRLRRNGENLQVLAGGTPPRRGNRPVGVVELLRAATSEVTDYQRVTLGNAPNASVRATGAADLVHILAELLENATRFSPPDRKVVLTADRGARGGLLFEVVDGGLGMAPDDLAAANERLATSDAVGPETTRRMGLFVVGQLAARHGVTVRLRTTHESANRAGVTASVHVPAALVIADGTPDPAPVPAMATIGAGLGDAELPLPQPAANGHTVDWFTPTLEATDEPVAWPPAEPAPHPPEPRPAESVTGAFATPPPTSAEPMGATTTETLGTPPPTSAEPMGSTATGPPRPATRAESTGTFGTPPPTSGDPVGTTAAGLPMRRPGGQAVPARQAGRPDERGVDFRDPETIRNNLSRHYSGMQAARRARQETEGRGS